MTTYALNTSKSKRGVELCKTWGRTPLLDPSRKSGVNNWPLTWWYSDQSNRNVKAHCSSVYASFVNPHKRRRFATRTHRSLGHWMNSISTRVIQPVLQSILSAAYCSSVRTLSGLVLRKCRLNGTDRRRQCAWTTNRSQAVTHCPIPVENLRDWILRLLGGFALFGSRSKRA